MLNNEKQSNGYSNIFELLPITDLNNENGNMNNYLENYFDNEYFDIYNIYPKIYKNIGKYLYNNYFSYISRYSNLDVLNINEISKMADDIFEFYTSSNEYNENQYPLLHDIILIVVLNEIERNNYQIIE